MTGRSGLVAIVAEAVHARGRPTTADQLRPAMRRFTRTQVAAALRSAKAAGLIAGTPGRDALHPPVYTPAEVRHG